MIDKLLSAQHIAEESNHLHVLKKKEVAAPLTRLCMLYSGDRTDQKLPDQIWKTLETAYFETLQESDPYLRFEEALKIVNADINNNNALDRETFLSTHSIILGLFDQGTLHITTLGNADVYLVRKNKLSIISEGLSPRKLEQDFFVNIASGELEDGDSVVFSSLRLLRHATQNQLTNMLSSGVLEAKESLQEMLRLAEEDASFVVFHARKNETLPLKEDVPKKKIPNLKHISGNNFFTTAQEQLHSFWKKFISGEQKQFLAFVVAILGILAVIIFSNLFSEKADEEASAASKVQLEQIDQLIENVKNQHTAGDTERANTTLQKIERDLQEVLNSGFFRAETLRRMEAISFIRDEINNVTRISTPRQLANLKSNKSDVQAQGVFSYADEWFAFDHTTLFRILLDGVENVFPLTENEQITHGVPLSERKKMVFSTNDAKFLAYLPQTGAVASAKTSDEVWKNHVALSSYGSFVYLLSPQDNQIWKYEDRSESFGSAIPYLAEEYDLSQAVSFAIDGFIFVLTKDGQVMKFLKGIQQAYEIVDAPADIFLGASQIYTHGDMDKILFLHPENSSIYIFFKGTNQMVYERQIVLENVGTLQSLWAKAPKTIAVADEEKVYEIDF